MILSGVATTSIHLSEACLIGEALWEDLTTSTLIYQECLAKVAEEVEVEDEAVDSVEVLDSDEEASPTIPSAEAALKVVVVALEEVLVVVDLCERYIFKL